MSRQCVALQLAATRCNALQRTATHCSTMQRTATHCNSGVLSWLFRPTRVIASCTRTCIHACIFRIHPYYICTYKNAHIQTYIHTYVCMLLLLSIWLIQILFIDFWLKTHVRYDLKFEWLNIFCGRKNNPPPFQVRMLSFYELCLFPRCGERSQERERQM